MQRRRDLGMRTAKADIEIDQNDTLEWVLRYVPDMLQSYVWGRMMCLGEKCGGQEV